MSKERLYLFDTPPRRPFARSREAASTNSQAKRRGAELAGSS